MTDFDKIDSKYRFVIIASKRAKELLKGAKARTKSKSKNLVRVAQQEVEMGLVDFEILKVTAEETSDQEERVFLGEEIAVEAEDEGSAAETEIFGEGVEAGEEAEEEAVEEEEEKTDSAEESKETEEDEDEGEEGEEED
ncbi:MAG: DNA-directed RNA polymerase subunit omega [Candidatus Aminicenantes bacterium]|nr:DNA-directed RNA polymerase subunit omega [Candidatus Aminicenantes bacterium]